jgi:hypothetical protein
MLFIPAFSSLPFLFALAHRRISLLAFAFLVPLPGTSAHLRAGFSSLLPGVVTLA